MDIVTLQLIQYGIPALTVLGLVGLLTLGRQLRRRFLLESRDQELESERIELERRHMALEEEKLRLLVSETRDFSNPSS